MGVGDRLLINPNFMSENTQTEREELKALLDGLGVTYAKNAPTKKLIELRDAQAHVVTEEDLAENPDAEWELGETIYLPVADVAEEGAETGEEDEDDSEAGEGTKPAEDDAGEPDEDDTPEETPDDGVPTETGDYIVVTPVKYQGEIHEKDAELRLNPEDAIRLLKNKAIRQA